MQCIFSTCLVYLGAIFKAEGKFASLMKNRIANKHCNMLKLCFCAEKQRLTILHEAPCVRFLPDFLSAVWVREMVFILIWTFEHNVYGSR